MGSSHAAVTVTIVGLVRLIFAMERVCGTNRENGNSSFVKSTAPGEGLMAAKVRPPGSETARDQAKGLTTGVPRPPAGSNP